MVEPSATSEVTLAATRGPGPERGRPGRGAGDRPRGHRLARVLLVGLVVVLGAAAMGTSPAGQRVIDTAFGVTVIEAPKSFEATAMELEQVLVLGDSLSNLGADAISAQFSDVLLKIDAHNGRNLAQGLERVTADHGAVGYEAALVALGTNDVELDRTQTATALEGILQGLDQVPCILLTTVQPTLYEDTEESRLFGARAEEINALLRAADERSDVIHIVEFGPVAADNPQYHDGMIDLLHLNPQGSQALAAEMRAAFEEACRS